MSKPLILDFGNKFLEIREDLVKGNILLQLMSGCFKKAAMDEEVLEGILSSWS